MLLGDTTTVQVADLTFTINMPWGRLRKLTRQFRAVDGEDVDEMFDAITNALRDTIVDCKGLVNADGEAVAWNADLIEELPAEIVSGVFSQLLNTVDMQRPGEPPLVSGTPPVTLSPPESP